MMSSNAVTEHLGASGLSIRYLSLVSLVVQNSALILVMRFTRASVPEDKLYLPSTAVVMSEVMKTLVFLFVLYTIPPPTQRSLARLTSLLYRELIQKWRETSKLGIPATLYLIQNNLQYVAATNLDAATFQVTYQLKILTTAFFSVVLLNRKLSAAKWLALGLLTVGIALVVLPKDAASTWFGSWSRESIESTSDTLSVAPSIGNQSNAKGFFAVLSACVLSGLAGVYFEKILKNVRTSKSTEKPDDEQIEHLVVTSPEEDYEREHAAKYELWIRNIQMSLFSVFLGLVFVVLLQDGSTIVERGFFVNYTALTWLVILIQAVGGIIVALVVKYADNILKGFATSISIILSSLVSIWLFNFDLSFTFIVGAGLVIYATFLYSR